MQLGFNIIPVIKQDKGHLIDKYNFDLLTDLADFHNIPYDGLVFSFDSVKYSESLGETSHHPLHSIAFKFEDESVKTILKDIEWSVGRTGVITPVAIFNPVEIGGTQVGRASVHNLSIVEDLELGIGDEISIIKANMIIPQIEENFTRSNNITIPLKCPVCGSNVIIEQLNDSKVLRCTNDYCTAKKLKKFAHFVSRDAMNIEGLSEATIEKLINKGLLHTLTDIYRLYEYENIIINMEGFGERSFEKLTSAIGKSRNIEMANFIYALGIDQIGLGGAKRLANYFNNDINAFLNANYYNFLDIPDFGAITAQAIYDHFKNLSNHNEILDLLTEITIKKPEISREEILKGIKDNPFKGTKVYATGTFANYKKDEIQKYLESLGAEFAAGYAKSLNYLIVGSVKGSGKEAKAKADGIPILQENEFMEMIKKID
jgi:DNA ligase (NAD+)